MARPKMKVVPSDHRDEKVIQFEQEGHETQVACWLWEQHLVVEIRDPTMDTLLIYNGHGAWVPWPREVWEGPW
jgi:hypothetical protein